MNIQMTAIKNKALYGVLCFFAGLSVFQRMFGSTVMTMGDY